jgi:hypothetical protein
MQADPFRSLSDRKRPSLSFGNSCLRLTPFCDSRFFRLVLFRLSKVWPLRMYLADQHSIRSFRFKASEFLRKLPLQVSQDELRVLVIVPPQGCYGEQQFRERLEKMTSFRRQFKFP